LGTNLSSNLHLHGEVAYKHFNNMVYLQNDSTEIETFQVKYTDTVNALGIKLGASFQFGERYVLDAESEWFVVLKSTFKHIPHQPGVTLRVKGDYNITSELHLGATLDVMDNIYFFNTATQTYDKTRGVFDIGTYVEYTLAKRLDMFIHLQNLTNRVNERWNAYPSYGFNVFGGVRLKF